MHCDKTDVGKVIGPRGSTIRWLQDESGASIDVEREGGPQTKITIKGDSTQVEAARKLLDELLNPPTETFTFPSRKLPKLIGTQGSTIKGIQENTGAWIKAGDSQYEKGSGHGAEVTISGDAAAVAEATALVKAIVFPASITVPCPKDAVAALIGDDGDNLRDLRKECGDIAGSDIDIDISIKGVNKEGTNAEVRIESSHAELLEKLKVLVMQEIAEAVEAGDTTGPEGTSLRAEANEWALKRSHFYHKAEKAREKGEPQQAAEMIAEAKKCGQMMRETNRAAAKSILKHNNDGKGDLFIDLHGLQVQEALRFLEQRLDMHLANATVEVLECVTGAGHHSPGKLAKIRPAVAQLCTDRNLKCADDDNPGVFQICC